MNYLATDRHYEEQCAEASAFENFLEELDLGEVLNECDDMDGLGLALYCNDANALASWHTWLINRVQTKWQEKIEQNKQDAGEAEYDAYISRMEDCF
jgi:hypothetical protein